MNIAYEHGEGKAQLAYFLEKSIEGLQQNYPRPP